MVQAILDNHLLLAALILLFLVLVPALLLRGRGVRPTGGADRRSQPRPGTDRRA